MRDTELLELDWEPISDSQEGHQTDVYQARTVTGGWMLWYIREDGESCYGFIHGTSRPPPMARRH